MRDLAVSVMTFVISCQIRVISPLFSVSGLRVGALSSCLGLTLVVNDHLTTPTPLPLGLSVTLAGQAKRRWEEETCRGAGAEHRRDLLLFRWSVLGSPRFFLDTLTENGRGRALFDLPSRKPSYSVRRESSVEAAQFNNVETISAVNLLTRCVIEMLGGWTTQVCLRMDHERENAQD